MPDRTPSAWATRLRRPRWSDPRLLVGLALVAIATVAGARLVAGADDTTPVWATTADVRAGDPVQAAELVVSRVRIGDGGAEEAYLPVADAPPGGVFTRDLAAGELVPVSALGVAPGTEGAELSLSVALGDAPADLASGDLVDVWAVPAETAPGRGADAERVLQARPVLTVADPSAALGGTERQVLLRLDDSGDELAGPLARLAGGTVVLVRVGR